MTELHELFARDWCSCSFGYCSCYSNWHWWGRWLLAGIVILIFLIVLLSCFRIARRRRRRGVQPFYGTGWMAPTKTYYDSSHQMYNPNQGYPQQGGYNSQLACGQRRPQDAGTTFNPNDGYYGQSNYAVVQSPPPAYQPDNIYPPRPVLPTGK